MTNKCFWDCDTDGQVFETIVTVNYDELIDSEINWVFFIKDSLICTASVYAIYYYWAGIKVIYKQIIS